MTTPSTPDPYQPQPSAQPPQPQSPPDGAGAGAPGTGFQGANSSRSGSSRPGWLVPVIVGVTAIVALCCTGSIVLTAVSDDEEPDAAATGTAGPTTDDDATDATARLDDPNEAAEREEAEEAEEPEPEPGFGSGMWEVGNEIPAGTYVTTAGDGSLDTCYWARLAGFSGDFEDVIANDNLDSGARGRLEIAEGDAGVEFSGSCRWVEVSEAAPVDPGDEVGPGTWAVGDEVAPGTYVTETGDSELTDSCYWARLSGFSGEFDDLIANDNIAAGSRGRVEIASSDTGVTFSGGCTWTRN